ncbi:MAG: alanine dehydrogenase [Bacteroidales bacterium]|nr:alanine dehydrogenase [Bacteroidales bacterium]
MVDQKSEANTPFLQSGLLPQDEMLEVGRKHKKLIIGIPKEDLRIEKRIAFTPEAVEILVNNGHDVLIEKGAGEGARYTDRDYSEKGAFIIDEARRIFNADIIIRTAPFAIKEIEMLKGNQVVMTPLNIMQRVPEYFRKLMNKKITAIAFEFIKNNQDSYPVQQSMNSINGINSVMIASELLSSTSAGKGVLLGGISGITPTEVVIIGAGTAAEYAARAAHGLGAFVKVFDVSPQRLEQLQNRLGQRIYTSIFHPQVIQKALKSTDVLIGAIDLPQSKIPYYITSDMVQSMKKGSVIIDLNIVEGGCFETTECRTHADPTYIKHDVIHYSVTNVASRVARTATIAISNILNPIVQDTGNSGGIKSLLKANPGVRNGVYIYNGILTNDIIGNKFDIPSKDIELLMAAF